jgi:hypothetical protein
VIAWHWQKALSMKFDSIISATLAGIGLFFGAEVAQAAPERADCVGRLEIMLPSDADVAAYSFIRFSEEVSAGTGQPHFQFDDGQNAGWSHVAYGQQVFISHRLTPEQIAKIKEQFSFVKQTLQAKAQNNKTAQKRGIDDVTVPGGSTVAWSILSSIRALVQVDQHLISLIVDKQDKGLDASRRALADIAAKTVYRPIFNSPKAPGICMPYAFIGDNNTELRSVATTYRLKEYPDLIVSLQDGSAVTYTVPIREKNALPEVENEDFWQQYALNGNVQKISSVWKPNTLRQVSMAGRKGLASFVQIDRKDGSVDFGYMAAVRGDPKASEDAPDMQFFVIGDGSRARAKGATPLQEEQFLEMAQKMVASVRHRPIK